ncbi:unnamed protein product [Toxocara canis]|uniref:DUF7044 domain-containing protein n=1 Tax=Toxocara canis TaxID=6265 RepID=A0A183UIY6_TOXCA|nr:unnamed protein product [Toxocara canis]
MNQHNHHYLFHLNSGSGSCYRCVAFFPVHKNVLQFKQTRCIQSFADSENIGSVCRRSFRGDAPMTTLFRGIFWRNFMIALTLHIIKPAQKYHIPKRMIHERASSGGRMGISADASCSELTDMSFASTVLNYKQDSAVTARCHFPPFLVHDHHSDAPRIWKSIVTDHTHRFSKDEWIEQWEGLNRSVSLCVDEENLGSAHRLIVHAVHGCSSGYQCIKVRCVVIHISLSSAPCSPPLNAIRLMPSSPQLRQHSFQNHVDCCYYCCKHGS